MYHMVDLYAPLTYWCIHFRSLFFLFLEPLPPEIDKLSVQKGCITITWSLQRESFFKIEYFIIELTTDDWQAPQTFFCLGTEFNHRVQNLSTTTTFRFRVVTCTHNLIKSRPSSEIKTTVIGEYKRLTTIASSDCLEI